MNRKSHAFFFADLYYCVGWLLMTASDRHERLRQIDPSLLETLHREAFRAPSSTPGLHKSHLLDSVTSQVNALFANHPSLNDHLAQKAAWLPGVEAWLDEEGRALIQSALYANRVSNLPTRQTLSTLLPPFYRPLLETIPDYPEDIVDAFVFNTLRSLASANRGCGLPAIQAGMKLKAMNSMSYQKLRQAAQKSPDFLLFIRANENTVASGPQPKQA